MAVTVCGLRCRSHLLGDGCCTEFGGKAECFKAPVKLPTLAEQIAAASAWLESLKLRALTANCQEIGSHDYKSTGGANCGCPDGACSVPVNVCTRCSDCDYGDNDEANQKRAECAAKRDIPEEIYYSITNGNFYSMPVPGGEPSKGQGNEFYRYWRARRAEFPQCDCQMVPTHISMECPIHG